MSGGGSPYSGAGLGERFESVSLSIPPGKEEKMASNGNRERRVNKDTTEERFFQSSLLMLEGHFERPQTYMSKAMAEVKKMVAQTLDQSLNKADVRYGFLSFAGF